MALPGSRPAQPPSAGNQPIVEAAVLGGITAHAVLFWPLARRAGYRRHPRGPAGSAAALLHVTDGDTLRLKDRLSGQYVRFVVTGMYRPRQVSSEYWNLNDIALTGARTASGFTTYGPLAVQAGALAGPSAALGVYQGSWLAQPQTASVPASELSTVAGRVDVLRQTVQNAEQLPDLALATSLPAVLNGTASDLDVARSLLAISAVLLSLLAAAALLAVARLLAGQREGESAMLTARGANRWQLVRLAAAEAIPLCLLASAVGGIAGVLLARLLAGTGSAATVAGHRDAGGRRRGGDHHGGARAQHRDPGHGPARRGRQAAISRLTKAGADVALVLLAVVAGWQLRHYSAVSPARTATSASIR